MRDCENCRNYKKEEGKEVYSCSQWECDFDPIVENYVCGDCKYCNMTYDKNMWEIYYCTNNDGRGTDAPENEACDGFELIEVEE